MPVRIANSSLTFSNRVIRNYTDASDEDLMILFQNGDERAFETLMMRHTGLLWKVVRKYFGPQADIDDLTQDISLSLWQNKFSWKPGIAKFSSWLYRVATNRCIDILRQKKEITLDEKIPEHILSNPQTAEDNIHRTQISKHLLHLLDDLPPQQMMALKLFYYEEAEIEEICTRMQASEQSVRSYLKRGKQGLRDRMAVAL
jgi:RNA polymerase sigma-70 factor (ECF subfamily)